MNKVLTILKVAVVGVAVTVTTFLSAPQAQAQSSEKGYYQGVANTLPLDSTAGATLNMLTNNQAAWPTNGLYPASIAGGLTTVTTVVTNDLVFDVSGFNAVTMQLTASAFTNAYAANGMNAATNTVIFQFYSAVRNPSLVISTNLGCATNAVPMSLLGSYTLALNGASPVSTNVTFTSASLPIQLGGVKWIILHTVTAAAGTTVTNYSVYPNGKS